MGGNFYFGSSEPNTWSHSIDVESASGVPSQFVNLGSTDSKGELSVESSLGCMTDCSTSENCKQGPTNVHFLVKVTIMCVFI